MTEYESVNIRSDGVSFDLESGETIRPVLKDSDGESMFANKQWTGEQKIVFGRDADENMIEMTFEAVEPIE